jgi:hypothetical protein
MIWLLLFSRFVFLPFCCFVILLFCRFAFCALRLAFCLLTFAAVPPFRVKFSLAPLISSTMLVESIAFMYWFCSFICVGLEDRSWETGAEANFSQIHFFWHFDEFLGRMNIHHWTLITRHWTVESECSEFSAWHSPLKAQHSESITKDPVPVHPKECNPQRASNLRYRSDRSKNWHYLVMCRTKFANLHAHLPQEMIRENKPGKREATYWIWFTQWFDEKSKKWLSAGSREFMMASINVLNCLLINRFSNLYDGRGSWLGVRTPDSIPCSAKLVIARVIWQGSHFSRVWGRKPERDGGAGDSLRRLMEATSGFHCRQEMDSYCKALGSENAQVAKIARSSNRIHERFMWASLAWYIISHSNGLSNSDELTPIPFKPHHWDSFSMGAIRAWAYRPSFIWSRCNWFVFLAT